MPGVGEVAVGAVRVVDGVDAGGDVVLEAGGDPVEVAQHLGGGEVEVGEGAGGGAQPPHGGRGVDAAAHDITHDESGLVVRERYDVEPIAADLDRGARRLVAGRDLQARPARRVVGEQAALEGDGGVADALVPAGVVDPDGGAGGQLTGEGEVVLVERQRVAGPDEPQGAE